MSSARSRAPGGALVREVSPVEKAPRRAQATAPAPAPRSDASLGFEELTRRGSPTGEQITLDLNVEVESLRMELLLSQQMPLPQYDLPPRLSPAAGMRLEESGEPHPEMQQTDQGRTFSFQAGVDSFLYVNCTRIPERGGTFSFQANVGANPETTTRQVPLTRSLRDCR